MESTTTTIYRWKKGRIRTVTLDLYRWINSTSTVQIMQYWVSWHHVTSTLLECTNELPYSTSRTHEQLHDITVRQKRQPHRVMTTRLSGHIRPCIEFLYSGLGGIWPGIDIYPKIKQFFFYRLYVTLKSFHSSLGASVLSTSWVCRHDRMVIAPLELGGKFTAD